MRTVFFGYMSPWANLGTYYSFLDSGYDMSTDVNFNSLCACKGTLHHLMGWHNSAMLAGSWVYAVGVNQVASALRMTMDTTDTKNRDFEHRVRVSPGDLLQMQSIATGTPTMRAFRWTCIFEADNPREQPLMAGYNQNAGVSTTYNFVMGYNSWNATESNRYQYIPTTGVIKNLYAKSLTNAPGAGKTHTLTLMLNGVATSLAAVFGAADLTAKDIDPSHAVNVVAGDYVSIRNEGTAGGNAMVLMYGCVFQPEINGEAIVMQRDTDTVSTTLTNYLTPVGYDTLGWTTVTGPNMGCTAGFTVKKHYVYLSGAAGPTGADGYTFSVFDTLNALAYVPLTVLGASTSASDTTTTAYYPSWAAFELMNAITLRCVPTGSPNAVSTWNSFVRYLPPDKVNDYNLRNQLSWAGKNGGRIPLAKGPRLRRKGIR